MRHRREPRSKDSEDRGCFSSFVIAAVLVTALAVLIVQQYLWGDHMPLSPSGER